MIELLEAGQPVYDISVEGVGYEEGKKLAKERYDLIQYQMEHGVFEPHLLRQFMQGLVDGGPDQERPSHADGHRHAARAGPGCGDREEQSLGHRADSDRRRPRAHVVPRAQRRSGPDVCLDRALSVRAARVEGRRQRHSRRPARVGQPGVCLAHLGHHRHPVHRESRSVADESRTAS